jgi:hypothetical protein
MPPLALIVSAGLFVYTARALRIASGAPGGGPLARRASVRPAGGSALPRPVTLALPSWDEDDETPPSLA